MAARRVDPASRRTEICKAAIEIFARDGFQGATIDCIAAAAGISKGSIYRYFHDKETLFHAAFETAQNEVMAEGREAMGATVGAWDQLVVLVRTSVAGWQRNLAMFPLVLEIWAAASTGSTRDRLGAQMADIYRRYRMEIAGLIRQGQAEGELAGEIDASATATWLVGALDGVLLQHWFDRSVDPGAAAEQLLAILRDGLRAADRNHGSAGSA